VTKHFYTYAIQSSNHIRYGISLAALVFMAAPAFAQKQVAQTATNTIQAGAFTEDEEAAPKPLASGDRVVVTARRVEEDVQDVPIAVAVLSSDFLSDTGSSNAGRLKDWGWKRGLTWRPLGLKLGAISSSVFQIGDIVVSCIICVRRSVDETGSSGAVM
jgi:hypothetical protein